MMNRRKAIRSRCLDCSGFSYSEVRNCTFDDCSLYPFRTGRGKQDPEARAEAIREHCLWCMGDQPKEVRLCVSLSCPLYPYRMVRKDRPVDAEIVHIDVDFSDNSVDPIPRYA